MKCEPSTINWLTDNREYHNEYWDDVDIKLKNPTKEM